MTTFDTDPDTHTVAAGWASSPLGNPDHDFFLDDPAEPTTVAVAGATPARPARRYAIVASILACGVGAALALLSGDFRADQPIVVTPSPGAPAPAVLIAPHSQVAPPSVAGPGPTAAASAPSPAHVATAPAAAPAENTAVDVPTTHAPTAEAPAEDEIPPAFPEDPAPEPPVLDDLPFDQPVPPTPEPPVFDPDLPLAPAPDPQPDPMPLPDFDIKAGPNS